MRFLELGTTTPVAHIKNISFSHCRFKSPGVPDVKFRPQDNVKDWRFSDVVFEYGGEKSPQELFKGIEGAVLDNMTHVQPPSGSSR